MFSFFYNVFLAYKFLNFGDEDIHSSTVMLYIITVILVTLIKMSVKF